MSLALRPYQSKVRQDIAAAFGSGARAVLAVMPTAGGKTIVFADSAGRIAAQGVPVLIAAHRRELIHQASAKLRDIGLAHGIIAPGHEQTRHLIQVGSVQTLGRRLDRIQKFGLIIPDEAHHSVAGQWSALFESQPDARILGFTATPERLDGRGLGRSAGGVFDALVEGPSVAELVAGGFIVPARVFAPAAPPEVQALHTLAGDFNPRELAAAMDRPSITGNAVDHYERLCPYQPAIAFCAGVEHAQHTAAAFRAEGWRAVCVHGGMPADERDAALAGLAEGRLDIVTSADLISEGVDVPRVGAVIMLRPTQSLGLYMQMVGRGFRLYPGKSCLFVLDHAGNVLRHGMPDAPRVWTLDGRPKRDNSAPAVRQCPHCFAIHAPTPACPECGFDYAAAESAARRRELERREGELAEMTADDRRLAMLRDRSLVELVREAADFEAMDEIRRARGYKAGWTPRQMAMRGRRQPGHARGEEFTTFTQKAPVSTDALPDPVLAAVASAWSGALGGRKVTTAELIKTSQGVPALLESITRAAGLLGEISTVKLGKWLSASAGKDAGGITIEKATMLDGNARWCLCAGGRPVA